jgi:hypothetical protein
MWYLCEVTSAGMSSWVAAVPAACNVLHQSACQDEGDCCSRHTKLAVDEEHNKGDFIVVLVVGLKAVK